MKRLNVILLLATMLAVTVLFGSCFLPDPLPLAISGTGGNWSSARNTDFIINNTATGTVRDFVSISFTGLICPYVGDISITIVTPDGEPFFIHDGTGGSSDFNGNYTFSMASSANFADSDADGVIDPGTYKVEDPDVSNDMYKKSIAGDWIVRIIDKVNYYSDGRFYNVTINITYDE